MRRGRLLWATDDACIESIPNRFFHCIDALGIVAAVLEKEFKTVQPLTRRQSLRAASAAALAVSFASVARAMTQTSFVITIRNVGADITLKLPNGSTVGAPIAPGVYVVAREPNLLFAPGGYADEALERLAEDGNFQPLLDKVQTFKDVSARGMFIPGQPFTVTASPGDHLQFATMFVQSNDLFFAPTGGGIRLFDGGGRAVHGNLSSRVALFDAGTEVNQFPGAGPDQAPRQPGPNTGATERLPIDLVANRRDGFVYPPVEAVIELTIQSGT